MMGCRIFLIILLALPVSVGCGRAKPAPAPSPGLTSEPFLQPAVGETPISADSPSTGTGGNGSGADGVSSQVSAQQEKQSAKNGSEEVAVNPAEWRRQNFKPRPFSDFKELRGYEEVRRLIPQPPSPTRIESGKRLYSQACIACHNLDGSPVGRDPALMRYNMADLSRPHQYLYGSSPKAIFRSIRFGVPSPPMGFTGEIYNDTEVWDMVNYIQSIQRL